MMFIKHSLLGILLLGASLVDAAAGQSGAQQTALEQADAARLSAVIAARSEQQRARDHYRHPQQTLEFFRVKPGMVVAEALPGGGWYSRILANYLGSDGALYGVNYVDRMWPMYSWATEKSIASGIARTAGFPSLVKEFTDNGITTLGFTFDTVPAAIAGTVDRVLFIRALHNLNRFEAQAGLRTQALAATRSMLKDDGLVGVVQHRAPESVSDASADGHRGYLKQSAVIAMFEQAGFELVDSSEINANPKDQPGEEEIVWRLPPSLNGSKDNPSLRAKMQAIGESDRMTLLFRKVR